MQYLQWLSIFCEAVVVILGVLLAAQKKKSYGWCIALCFAIYVYYDAVKLAGLSVSQDFLYVIFFIATISILWAVGQIYRETK
ncbi:MAG: hypothetical protein HQ564_04410 [Candidatus Saganbacteria bacterium]|nr:hypothetical protein [Candidatus Saganbacteria bacterium]